MRFDALRDRADRAADGPAADAWQLARGAFAWLVALAALALCASALGANPPVYRWVDENGVVHYGDHVPPQYAQSETAMLNRQGIEVGHTEAQKSATQLEQDARLEQQLVQQKQRDSFLLTTYSSVHEIELLRDERLQQLQGQRVAAEQFVSTLSERLLGLQTRAEGYKPYSTEPRARRMPDDLAEELVHTMNEIRGQREALATHEHQEASIRAQFQADIDRYRELKTPEQR
jgi:Domain of unknown function (DUF4124)